MSSTFADLVDQIRERPLEEKNELLHLLQREVIEARRDEIAQNVEQAKREYKSGLLKFTSSIADLKKQLNRP